MRRTSAALIGLALVAGACSGGTGAETAPPTDGSATARDRSVTVMPDPTAPVYVANVEFNEEGIEPAILFLPAGHTVRLVLRNRTLYERHYRIENLPATEVRYIEYPEIDSYDVDSLSEEELAQYGIILTGDEAELEHQLHHLAAFFVPVKEASLHGIKPLPGEVHDYTQRGTATSMIFTPIRTGRYEVEDPLNPEFTAEVIVYLPPGAEGI
jgi:hypothetical protein